MERNDAAVQGEQSRQQKISPVRISSGAWFYVRCGAKGGGYEDDAFVAHTYSSVRTLLARANSADTTLYLGSPQDDGRMEFRRVVAARRLPNTNMHILELEGGKGVLWDENKDVEAASAYVDIEEPVGIGQLADTTSHESRADSTPC